MEKRIIQVDEKVLDHINGSWFHQLDRNNQVIGTVWPGKSDLYHAVQATLIPYYAPDISIAPAVKRDHRAENPDSGRSRGTRSSSKRG